MSQLSPYLRSIEDNGLLFWCPGCEDVHIIHHGSGPGPRWTWNGDVNKPTFRASVLVQSGHHAPGHRPDDRCWCTFNRERIDRGEQPSKHTCGVCHSFVTDGRIQFLSDCTHPLAGQTVDLPELPDYLKD